MVLQSTRGSTDFEQKLSVYTSMGILQCPYNPVYHVYIPENLLVASYGLVLA